MVQQAVERDLYGSGYLASEVVALPLADCLPSMLAHTKGLGQTLLGVTEGLAGGAEVGGGYETSPSAAMRLLARAE